jgi:hypothetical protein
LPANPDFFTVQCDGIGAFGIDYVDPNTDPDEHVVYAFVWFKPRIPDGFVIWAPGLTPPRGIALDDVRGRFSPEDGKLRTIVAQSLNEKQRITVTGDPFTLTFDGQPTGSLAEASTPAQVLTALEALSNINPGDVFVSGQTQNEKQTVTVTGDPFTLTFDGEPTEPIDDSVNAGFVKAALQRLPNIGSGGCAVAGPSGGPFVVEFTGPLAGTNVAQMTGTNVTVETVIAGSTGSPFTVTFQGQYETVDVPALTATNATIETVQPGTPDLGVKLVANTALLALDELIYDVEFDVPDDTDNDLDDNRKILPFAISADVAANATINLATVERLPHRSELGI